MRSTVETHGNRLSELPLLTARLEQAETRIAASSQHGARLDAHEESLEALRATRASNDTVDGVLERVGTLELNTEGLGELRTTVDRHREAVSGLSERVEVQGASSTTSQGSTSGSRTSVAERKRSSSGVRQPIGGCEISRVGSISSASTSIGSLESSSCRARTEPR